MRANSLILLESNSAVLAQLQQAFSESKDFNVLYAGDDGDDGIKEILRLKPDLVIVGMFLKGTDGCGVIRAVKKTWADAKIVIGRRVLLFSEAVLYCNGYGSYSRAYA